MSFEIRNSNGESVDIDALNKEVSDFWGKPIVQHTEFGDTYSTVFPLGGEVDGANWTNTIGHAIEHPCLTTKNKVMQQSWNQIKHSMFNAFIEELDSYQWEYMVADVVEAISSLKYFFALVDYWEAKGYIPVRKS